MIPCSQLTAKPHNDEGNVCRIAETLQSHASQGRQGRRPLHFLQFFVRNDDVRIVDAAGAMLYTCANMNHTTCWWEGVQLDRTGSRPIYSQLVDLVATLLAQGKLRAGDRLPTVRELASALEVNPATVARAYAEMERAGMLAAHAGRGTFVAGSNYGDVAITLREDRLRLILNRAAMEALGLGYSPAEIEAALALQLARWSQSDSTARANPSSLGVPENVIIFMGSHDPLLDLMASELRRCEPPRAFEASYVGSLAGLMAIQRGEAHVAGIHLLDEETGKFNEPYVRRLLPGQDVVLITLAHRTQGFIVARGNPLQISEFQDLARQDVRFVNRQRGSGTRVLLDFRLRAAGLTSQHVRGYEREEVTHLAVAAAVAGGEADVGLGLLSAARAFGLGFVPVATEQYDLVIPLALSETPRFAPFFQVLTSTRFKELALGLGGYDLSKTGTRQQIPFSEDTLTGGTDVTMD